MKFNASNARMMNKNKSQYSYQTPKSQEIKKILAPKKDVNFNSLHIISDNLKIPLFLSVASLSVLYLGFERLFDNTNSCAPNI